MWIVINTCYDHYMTQVRSNPILRRAMGQRLELLVRDYLDVTWKALANQLGYRNDTVLRRARDGASGMSVEKLAVLATLRFGDEAQRVSIHWLLTGEGAPLRTVSLESYKGRLAQRVCNAAPRVQRQIAGFLDVCDAKRKQALADNL